jgi:hypothetical protein
MCAKGPRPCSVSDVARALASALEHPVKIAQIPRPEWRSWYLGLAFSQAAADAYVLMTAASVE